MKVPFNARLAPETARRLGIPLYRLYREAQRGLLGPTIQVGGRYVFSEEGILEYERRRKLKAGNHTPAALHANDSDESEDASSATPQKGKARRAVAPRESNR